LLVDIIYDNGGKMIQKEDFLRGVSKELARTRKKLGISQREMAERLGTKTPNISRLESGKQNFSLDSLYAYADALGYEPIFVLDDKLEIYGGKRDYTLKLFDEVLLGFSLDESFEGKESIEITFVNEDKKHLMPVNLNISPEGIKAWIKTRTISKNRAYVQEVLKSVNLGSRRTKAIIDVSKALSLNDSYWIDSVNSNLSFDRVNIYDNAFDEVLSLVAFMGIEQNIKVLSSSPELTTQGMLRKGWRRISGETWLYKGGSEDGDFAGDEPYIEFYASQIANRMGLSHVGYDLRMWKGVLASCCKLFTTKDRSFVPAAYLPGIFEIEDVLAYYKKLGKEYYESLCDMLVFDAVIYNTDRHFGNFGLLRDNKSGEFVSVAPVFDNGKSLFANAPRYDFDDLKRYRNKCSNPYERDWEYILGISCGNRQKEKLEKLKGFSFDEHGRYNLPSWKLEKLNEFIKYRVEEILSM